MTETIEIVGGITYFVRTFETGVVERVAQSDPEPSGPPQSLADARAGAIVAVYAQAKTRLDAAFEERYSPGERYLWADLERDARAAAAGEPLADDSVLVAEAAAVGADLAEYAAGVVANANQLRTYRAAIVAARAAHKAAIQALVTVEEVEAYDVSTGWPGFV